VEDAQIQGEEQQHESREGGVDPPVLLEWEEIDGHRPGTFPS
jgi:hypothetical protein